jgi:hypothetical protein
VPDPKVSERTDDIEREMASGNERRA